MAGFWTDAGALALQDGAVDWLLDDIRARLVLASAAPVREQGTLDGYTGVGDDIPLTGRSRVVSLPGHRVVYRCDDLLWYAVPAGFEVGWVVVYQVFLQLPLYVLEVPLFETEGRDIGMPLHVDGLAYTQQ